MKIFIKRICFLGALLVVFSGIISCEEDFRDIGSSIIDNSKFSTNDTILEVEITPVSIDRVPGDGLKLSGAILGEYLLGVYNNSNYEKIEASIVSQLTISPTWTVNHLTDAAQDTSYIHTELDTVILRIPYQATLASGTTSDYSLDSIIGDVTIPFNLNIYETSTYLSALNPENPADLNSYESDLEIDGFYAKETGIPLNEEFNYQFFPNEKDTVFYAARRAKPQADYGVLGVKDSIIQDTILILNRVPFARIPLKKAKFQEFMDKYESAEFDSQDAFNNYFRGIILEATGDNGSVIPLNFSGNTTPSIEVYYTNTVLSKAADTVISISMRNNSFALGGITNSAYKMSGTPLNGTDNFVVQGTAGSMANIAIFPDGLDDLRAKNWLINDASLTLYVDQDIVEFDTINTPSRLFLYKNGFDENGDPNPSQIKDMLSEGPSAFGGFRERTSEKKPDKYNFRITDYVSDLLSGDSDYNPVLGLKVYNPTSLPSLVTDTIVENYNWNPRMVTLLNHLSSNGTRRAQLKISYSIEK